MIVRILVTGAAGFIGSHVVDAFAAEGHAVTGFDVLRRRSPRTSRGRAVRPPIRQARLRLGGLSARMCASGSRRSGASGHRPRLPSGGDGRPRYRFADAPHYVSRNDLGTAVLLAEMAAAGVRRLVLAILDGDLRRGALRAARCTGPGVPGPRLVADLAAGRFEPRCPDCGAPLLTGLVSEDAPADPRNVYAATSSCRRTSRRRGPG